MMEAEEMQKMKVVGMRKWMSLKSPEDIQTNIKTGLFTAILEHCDIESAVWLDLRRERSVLSPEGSSICWSRCVRCCLRTRGVKS